MLYIKLQTYNTLWRYKPILPSCLNHIFSCDAKLDIIAFSVFLLMVATTRTGSLIFGCQTFHVAPLILTILCSKRMKRNMEASQSHTELRVLAVHTAVKFMTPFYNPIVSLCIQSNFQPTLNQMQFQCLSQHCQSLDVCLRTNIHLVHSSCPWIGIALF